MPTIVDNSGQTLASPLTDYLAVPQGAIVPFVIMAIACYLVGDSFFGELTSTIWLGKRNCSIKGFAPVF